MSSSEVVSRLKVFPLSLGRASEVARKYLKVQATLNEALRCRYAVDLNTSGGFFLLTSSRHTSPEMYGLTPS
jgi:hypothetical protein